MKYYEGEEAKSNNDNGSIYGYNASIYDDNKLICKDTSYAALYQYICKTYTEESGKKIYIIIDGMSGGGKSSLGKQLNQIFDGNLFAMDDFFLQKYQRNEKRLNEPGGNVDYERFADEVLSKLVQNTDFTYQRFNCQTMELGENVSVVNNRINIIEGSYSLHPYFTSYYDELKSKNIVIKAGIRITPEEQEKRILLRNGKVMLKRFLDEWIPKENIYLKEYNIYNQCDFIISDT